MKVNFEKNFDIKNHTMFKTGGKIAGVFFPENIDEFVWVLNENKNIQVLGNLSNTLVSDYGYDENIVLTANMNNITIDKTRVIADCGVKGPKLAIEVCEKNLSGLEFMIGFPGSVGGEVFMNASANSQSVSDKLVCAVCYSKEKGVVKYSKSEMDFGYRTSRCQKEDLVVLQAEFELEEKNSQDIKSTMEKNLEFRRNHQPSLALPNCGSIFKNPPNDSAGRLLDLIGAKNMHFNGAKVWENHANFIINSDNASSLDILSLMYEMYAKVKEMYNIELEPEIRFLGGNNKKENELWQKLNKK